MLKHLSKTAKIWIGVAIAVAIVASLAFAQTDYFKGSFVGGYRLDASGLPKGGSKCDRCRVAAQRICEASMRSDSGVSSEDCVNVAARCRTKCQTESPGY